MIVKSKSNKLLLVISLLVFIFVLLFFVPNWKQNSDFKLAVKSYPKAVELKSNTVYSQGGINIGVGNFEPQYLGIAITDDEDSKYFKSSIVKVGDLIEGTKYKIWIRAIRNDTVLIEVENLSNEH